MKIVFVYFIIIVLITSCISDRFVLIKAVVDGNLIEKKIRSDAEEITCGRFQMRISSIQGLDKFKHLKTLRLLYLDYKTDLSFLEPLSQLEMLTVGGSQINDFSLLKRKNNLKILLINELTIKNNEIDLTNNYKLEIMSLNDINFNYSRNEFDLIVKNIPSSLKYLDISQNKYVKIDKRFLDSLEKVPTVFLDKSVYQEFKEYFDLHPNFLFKKPDEVLPEEYKINNETKFDYDYYKIP